MDDNILMEEYTRLYTRYDKALACLEDLLEIAKLQNNLVVGQRIAQTMVEITKNDLRVDMSKENL